MNRGRGPVVSSRQPDAQAITKENWFMKHVLAAVIVFLLAGIGHPSATVHASAAGGAVKVTVHYTGKGTVDPSHKIWVWLFDNPNIGAGSMPIDQTSLDKNHGDVVFEGVAPGEVWIAVAFDEQGAMMGDAPPPTGTPIGILSKDGKPISVVPGDKGAASVSFDDTLRMP
jgi:hypothetical protein